MTIDEMLEYAEELQAELRVLHEEDDGSYDRLRRMEWLGGELTLTAYEIESAAGILGTPDSKFGLSRGEIEDRN